MPTITIVTGSARPGSVNQKMTDIVKTNLESKNVTVNVANLVDMNLPFFNAELPPSAEGYQIPHESVKNWSKIITESDGVVFVVPEYNHSLSAIQKNALDWLYSEWAEKPAAFVGYGWYGAANSFETFKHVNDVVKMKLGGQMTGLTFMKELAVDGSILDEAAVTESLEATIGELLQAV